MELEEIKKRVESIRAEQTLNKRHRWPLGLKKAIAAYCEQGSIKSVSDATGIPRQMIRSWLKAQPGKGREQRALFKEISVSEDILKSKIVIEWPGVMKIDGLSYAEVHELLAERLI